MDHRLLRLPHAAGEQVNAGRLDPAQADDVVAATVAAALSPAPAVRLWGDPA